MKSTPTPHTHTGVTTKELTLTYGGGGKHCHSVAVPAGTACKKLDGGTDPWVVANLSFMADKCRFAYSDADIYGIRVPESEISGIKEVHRQSESLRQRMR